MHAVEIIGRSSSHFTRVTRIFAEELAVPYELTPVPDMTSLDPQSYAGNPALKLPILKRDRSVVFGAQNVCRELAELTSLPKRIVWTEERRDDELRNAQELVWHAMAAQAQIVFGTLIAKLPADNLYFVKALAGFKNSLEWLERRWVSLRASLPPSDISMLEVTLFCLIEHIAFRETLPLRPYPQLVSFSREFSSRSSAQRTPYRFDPPAGK